MTLRNLLNVEEPMPRFVQIADAIFPMLIATSQVVAQDAKRVAPSNRAESVSAMPTHNARSCHQAVN
jgi:hypothetical protein